LRVWSGTATALALVACSVVARAADDPGQLISVATSPTVEDLRNLSIDQLAQLKVNSVERRPTPLSNAPAAIYVITHEDIVRSGAVTLPEILRLAPNLQVFQSSASSFVVTARGFSGNSPDQSFSNLMLVLIDGRSVYNPIFTGVYWDMQDLVPDDIDRIEVISGPAGTLWGANAVNGVINVITRKAAATQGGFVDYANGTLERSITAQYGGHIGEDFAFRVYARTLTEYDTQTPSGAKAGDEWSKPQGGFRFDWTPTKADSLSLRGDYFEGSEAADGAPNVNLDGRDIMGRWTHRWSEGGTLSLLAYWDREARSGGGDSGSPFFVDTYDVEVLDSFSLGQRNALVAGAGFRDYRYGIGDTNLVWTPSHGDLTITDVFAQDTVHLLRTLDLTLGVKLEDDPFSHLSPMPDIRLSWKARADVLVWAAASKVIRAPAPFDTGITELVGGKALLTGNPAFLPERLTAYQIGTRWQPSARWSISATLYDDVYDDLRNIQVTPVTFFPLTWGNGLRGHTWGLEAWTDYRLTSWWRLTAAVDVLSESLSFKQGATRLISPDQDGDDPRHTAQIRSSMDLTRKITFDADLRYVDALPLPSVPSYIEMDSRLAWRVQPKLEVSLAGDNLLQARHVEIPGGTAIPRSVRVELRAGF
jgi:iron complex outermembrane receptor protein